MKDKWMNVNYENDELKPYEEPIQDFNDNQRIGRFQLNIPRLIDEFAIVDTIVRDGTYAREQILDSLSSRKYDDIMAFYLLLGLRTTDVMKENLLVSFDLICYLLD